MKLEKNNVKTGKKQTKQNDLKKRRAKKSLTCNRYLNVHLSHLRVHNGEKPYTWGKSFTQKESFTAHMGVHSGEKLFICNQCGTSFAHLADLKVHINIHTGEKPCKCSQCDKTFTRSRGLKKHKVVHTGEKLHTCDQCGKSFTLK